MPGKTDLSRLNCSLARALGAVGDWWTLLIVRDAMFGVKRFSDFQHSLGIARNILSSRLARLIEADILARQGTEARPLYVLTAKGRALLPALVALMQWGDAWQSDGKPPVVVTDTAGRAIKPLGVRSPSGASLDSAGVRFAPGPGADKRTRAFFKARDVADSD
ncbi:helix-turn-helix transcriptional regulator [Bradyrhizobium sp. U87765 SZCCT0131]|uniref:winged helix-turn-helix transcriptional regulator n=1 Tax=unclassified Bradyrhizobium TaxID=2631580 RepID=UPI001BA9486E|nr:MULTISPECIES: helix-turn-helix domain-containing protein [unclassified Bradyrhizobium]MBR1223015.1 helix-turn-helix transcriptional regulator [Bradyrhizobium sp. U87765 SZCCT0131]MBR1262751.1 helix-turn-helix transcriptional regulator [Bradyrhizobium sp. U87765 SZCCT0134]MBR1308777.1 helix-turn-helix transcriptional regulator [Bradyrhizobium sp. U87765 SZCCT0110]MBR1318533.1 helix-turn-helix transcriptional regulator [Bradyrhizobium sp. U87765 SZCCT0109]MBR1352237.1 helix-turn-helix transcr